MCLIPKDSNVVIGVCDCAALKVPERYDRQTKIQTDRFSVHYSKTISLSCPRWQCFEYLHVSIGEIS